MLIWLFERMNLPESRIGELMERIVRVRTVLSAVFYTVMVFIVILGISGDVYAGFPKFVPYIIMAVFMFMAFVRMYQCLVDDGYAKRSVSKRFADREKKRAGKSAKAAETKNASDSSSEGQ